jgi:hypothetical protein
VIRLKDDGKLNESGIVYSLTMHKFYCLDAITTPFFNILAPLTILSNQGSMSVVCLKVQI